jgi:hypothetical protein
MQDVFVALIFGFGLVFVALAVVAFGILNDKYWLVLIGALLFVPFSYYIYGASRANGFALLPLLSLLLSAAAVREKNKRWAWILAAPALVETLWVVVVALAYQIR